MMQIRDELDIKFPTVANLDSTQMIRPDGKITLSLLGGTIAALGARDAVALQNHPAAPTALLARHELHYALR